MQQARGLAFAVGVRQHLAEGVVGEGFGAAVQCVSGPRGAVLEVVAVVKVFTIAGPVLHHTRLASMVSQR